MTLATKSGGLILRDGKIATNCACCDPCSGFCQPSGANPSDAVYLTISNYSSPQTYTNITVNGTYLLPRDISSGCTHYTLRTVQQVCPRYPPWIGLSGVAFKMIFSVSPSEIFMQVIDEHDGAGFPTGICAGFRFRRTTGFNACTQSTLFGASAGLLIQNDLSASFDWTISVNPLP